MATIHPGYRGYALIDTTASGGGVSSVRFADASINAKQPINAPDLVAGDWNNDAWNYGPIEVGGTISGPVTETFMAAGGGVFTWGTKRGGDCGDMGEGDITLYYYCGAGNNQKLFSGMLVNSLNFSCAAGDVAQFSIDVLGKAAGTWGTGTPTRLTNVEKLLTWDKVSLTVGGHEGPIFTDIPFSNFDFTVANNLETKYSLTKPPAKPVNDLFPYEIVPGIRKITGSLTAYNIPQADGADTWDDYLATDLSTITFNIGALSLTLNAVFSRVEAKSATGAITSTIAFTAVGPQPAWDT